MRAKRWTQGAQGAFKNNKKSLCREPMLFTPDFSKPFILENDTSGTALGTVPTQCVDGENRPVAYTIQRLLDHETCYATMGLECLDIK